MIISKQLDLIYGFTYLFFLFFWNSAFAIRCWQCSNIQGNCGDPFRDDYVSPSTFVDCSLRGTGYDTQYAQRLPYGQPYVSQWRQPWAQPQQPLAQAQIFGPQNRQWGTPVCVKAKSISKYSLSLSTFVDFHFIQVHILRRPTLWLKLRLQIIARKKNVSLSHLSVAIKTIRLIHSVHVVRVFWHLVCWCMVSRNPLLCVTLITFLRMRQREKNRTCWFD